MKATRIVKGLTPVDRVAAVLAVLWVVAFVIVIGGAR